LVYVSPEQMRGEAVSPATLDGIVMKCPEIAPEVRFHHGKEIATALETV
jgi:hypothetical protein